MRVVRTIVLLGLALTGPACRSMEDQKAALAGVYRLGMDRAALRSAFDLKPLSSASRPAAGWGSPEDPHRIHRVAAWFEKEHGTMVVHGDVYFVPRNWFGVYFDYVFFDEFERVTGFYRRFVD